MAQVYKVENKRYDIIEVDSAIDTSYDLTDADHNRWIKVNTDTIDVDINMPDGLTQGFRCVIENTGETTVNYVNQGGTSVATQQGRFTEDKWRTVELVFDNSEWRIQGFVGRQDLGSLFDVNTEVNGGPEPGDALLFDNDLQTWVPGSPTPYTPTTALTNGYVLSEDDHNQTIVFEGSGSKTVTVNLELPDGLYCTILNVGTGPVNLSVAGTLNAISSTLVQWQSMELIHGGNDIYYGSVSYTEPPANPEYIQSSYVGGIPTLSSVTSESFVAGSNAVSDADSQVVIGKDAEGRGVGDICIGEDVETFIPANTNRIGIGFDTRLFGNQAIGIGFDTEVTGDDAIAIGSLAEVSGDRAIQLGPGLINDEEETIKFLDTYIACAEGVVVPQEDANNTTTTTQRFVADEVDGGLPHHNTFGHLAFSKENKILYISEGLNTGKEWFPLNVAPNIDYIESRIRGYDLVTGVVGGTYFPPEYEAALWATDTNDDPAINQDGGEQYASIIWLDESTLTGNNDRKYIENEPYFRRLSGGGFSGDWYDKRVVRWVRTTNTLGFTGASSSNGPFNVDRSLFDTAFPNAQTKDRILFTGQTNTDENGIYRVDSIGTSFVTFNRPEDLQIGDTFSDEDIFVWGEEQLWAPTTASNTVGDPIAFIQGASSTYFPSNAGLYFRPNADGRFRVNMRLRFISIDGFASFDARARLRLYRGTAIFDEWWFNLATKDATGADVLNNLRLDESLELENGEIYYFTLTLYDTAQYVFIQSSGSAYQTSYIKITPEQLYFAPNNV